MTAAELESMYEALADSVDAVGEKAAPLFLAKVALALAEELDDAEAAKAIFKECQHELVPA